MEQTPRPPTSDPPEGEDTQPAEGIPWLDRHPWLHLILFTWCAVFLQAVGVAMFAGLLLSTRVGAWEFERLAQNVDLMVEALEDLGASDKLQIMAAGWGLPLLFVLYAWQWGLGRPRTSLGLIEGPRVAPALLVGLGQAALLLTLMVAAAATLGVMTPLGGTFTAPELLALAPDLAFGSCLMLVVAFAEEVMVRGYVLQVIWQRLGAWPGLLLTTGWFTAMHISNPDVTARGLMGVASAGLLLGLITLRDGHLWRAIGLHWGWNVGLGLVLGLPVSGQPGEGLLRWQRSPAADFWMGGAFGPEEGLLAILVMGLMALWTWARLEEPRLPSPEVAPE